MSKKSQDTPTPFLKALLLCEEIIVDERSKKKTLVGIFDNINVEKFPYVHLRLMIYVRVMDAQGEYRFRIDYVQVKTDQLLGRSEIPPITIQDRLRTQELIITPPPIPIPAPGEYEFRLWANDRYVGRVSFTATERPRGKRGV